MSDLIRTIQILVMNQSNSSYHMLFCSDWAHVRQGKSDILSYHCLCKFHSHTQLSIVILRLSPWCLHIKTRSHCAVERGFLSADSEERLRSRHESNSIR